MAAWRAFRGLSARLSKKRDAAMPPRAGDARSYWSDTPLTWEDMHRIISSGALDVRRPCTLGSLTRRRSLSHLTPRPAQDLVRSRDVCARYNDFTDEVRAT